MTRYFEIGGWTWQHAFTSALTYSKVNRVRVRVVKGAYGWGFVPLYGQGIEVPLYARDHIGDR